MTIPPPTFPTIDISPFLTPTTPPSALLSTAHSISTACAHPGFFYLTHHNLPPTLTTSVLSHARHFFLHAPPTEKALLKRQEVGHGSGSGDGARGYQLIGDNVTQGRRDWHEAIDFYRPVVAGEPHPHPHPPTSSLDLPHTTHTNNNPPHDNNRRQQPYTLLHGLNAWPASPPSFRPVYEDYIAKMQELGTAVVRAMGMALGDGMEDVFVRNTRRSWWVLRAIGYPPLPAEEEEGEDVVVDGEGRKREGGGVSCGAHSDYGCVTLLLADGTRGALQAWVGGHGGEGGRWVNVEPVEGAVVVNIGDMMERWSGGRWKATKHRVVHRGEGFRVSVPFFFEPDWDARVPGKAGEGEVVFGEYLEAKVRGNF